MARARRLLLIVSLLATVSACSGVDRSTTPEPTAAVPSPATSPRIFESSRHGYRVEVPPEWDVTEYPGTWKRLEQFSAGAEVPGEDVLLSPDGASFLVANSMPIPEGMSAAEWRAAFDARVEAGLDPSCSGTTKPGVFLDEPATIVRQECQGSTIVGRSLTHEGRGSYFTTLVPDGDPAADTTVDELVASIRFVDD